MELFAVVCTHPDEMTTEHSLWLTEADAARRGAELARAFWDDENDGSFPNVDDWGAMDVARMSCGVRLEVEPIDVSPEVLAALKAL